MSLSTSSLLMEIIWPNEICRSDPVGRVLAPAAMLEVGLHEPVAALVAVRHELEHELALDGDHLAERDLQIGPSRACARAGCDARGRTARAGCRACSGPT